MVTSNVNITETADRAPKTKLPVAELKAIWLSFKDIEQFGSILSQLRQFKVVLP